MKTSTTSAVLPCTPETFWAVFLDESYLSALYLTELECRAFSVLEIGDASRRLRIVPNLNLPGPVAMLIGDSFAYEDHGTLDRAKNEWTWQMVQPGNLDANSNSRSDVVTMHGTIRIEAIDDGHCQRTDTYSVEANIFGLSGLIESSVEAELQSGRAKEYAFFTAWSVGTGRVPA
jgi:hypothetical protein